MKMARDRKLSTSVTLILLVISYPLDAVGRETQPNYVKTELSLEQKNELARYERFSKKLVAFVKRHTSCTSRHAKILALNSIEPAETIAKAAQASCYEDRDRLNKIYREFELPDLSVDEWEKQERESLKFIILEVIKQRAVKPPLTETPAKRETPI